MAKKLRTFYRSFYNPSFFAHMKIFKMRYECIWCDKYTEFKNEDLRDGIREDNMDQSYSFYCTHCDEPNSWEPFFDGYYRIKYNGCHMNNIMVFGSYIKHCQKESGRKVGETDDYDEEELKKYLSTAELFVLPEPETPLSKKDFMTYISKQYKLIMEEKVKEEKKEKEFIK